MISNRVFKTIEELNKFVDETKFRIISIETIMQPYDTGLPFDCGGTFITERDVIRMWYEI